MLLSELTVGKRARIKALMPADKLYRQKLIAMGLLPGTELTLSRIAPLGDPVEILVRGVALCLRKVEANLLELEGV